jgi:hypothetical protein
MVNGLPHWKMDEEHVMGAIVFGELGFDLGPRKLVVFRVDRSDLPHLTCSWKNPSGEVDLHLTPTSPRDEHDHESILRIHEPELKARFRDLIKQIIELVLGNPLQMVWCVQPKWLAKRGYLLVGPTDEPISLWFQRALLKKRGKYRLDGRVFKQLPKMALYRPTPGRFAKLGREGQMYAVCMKGPSRKTTLMLARLDWALSSPTWVAVNIADIANLIKTAKRSRLLPQWFATLAPKAWERMSEALQLREIGL